MKVPRLGGECRTKSYTFHNNVVIHDLNPTSERQAGPGFWFLMSGPVL